jgi:hypothetical protein
MKLQSIVALSCVLTLFGAAATACGGNDSEPTAETSASVVAGLEGTYDFLLDASDVAARIRARCASDSHGDESRAASCWSEIEKEASTEKIRFSRNSAGQLVYTSFGVASGKEEVFLEVPLTVSTTADPGALSAKATGWPSRGTMIAKFTHARAQWRLEQPGDGTLVVVDKDKGRLVYRRAG